MTAVQTTNANTAKTTVDMKLEVVVLPVADVDRAKDFYTALGWRLDADFGTGPDFRVVQVTPPGSEASVIFGKGITAGEPGSVEDLQLTVFDIDEARDALAARGVDVSDVYHDAGGIFHHAGHRGARERPGRGPRRLRLLRVLPRPGRQRLGAAGDQGAPARSREQDTTKYESAA